MANEIFRTLSEEIQKMSAHFPKLSEESDGSDLVFLGAIDACMKAGTERGSESRDASIGYNPLGGTDSEYRPSTAFMASRFYFYSVAQYYASWLNAGKSMDWLSAEHAKEGLPVTVPAFPAMIANGDDKGGGNHPFFVSLFRNFSGAGSKTVSDYVQSGLFSGIKDIGEKLPNTWAYVNPDFSSADGGSNPVTGLNAFKPMMKWIYDNWDTLAQIRSGKASGSDEKKEPEIAARKAPESPKIPKVVGMAKQIAAFHVAMKARKPSMLVGPTGSGKTHLVKQYCAWDNGERAKEGKALLPLVVHTFHQESSPTEIIGTKTLDNGTVKWVDSEFMKLFSNGGTYFADEFNFAPAGAHAPLFAALNGDDEIFVPESGKTYARHPDFRFVAACNPASKYGGRQPVDKALASRFYVSVDFGYLAPAEERSLLLSRVPGLTKEEATKVVSVANALRDAESKGMLFVPFGTRDALHVAALITEGYPVDEAVEHGFALKSDNDEQRAEIRKAAGSAKTLDIRSKEDYELERDAAVAAADKANKERDRVFADNKAMYKELETLRERAKKFDELRKALAA